MSIAMLLEAAAHVERAERRDRVEDEHGYATTMPPKHQEFPRRRQKTRKTQGNRSTHNELEKNRRAHLRHCLEKLKEIVPLGADCTRHTTLGLLVKAKGFIKILEDKDRKQSVLRDQLHRERRQLQRKLDELTEGQYRHRIERSLSECSASTISTTSAYSSESDEVDILGYGSSDTDDHSSIQSGSSDGCTSGTRRLTLSTPSSSSPMPAHAATNAPHFML